MVWSRQPVDESESFEWAERAGGWERLETASFLRRKRGLGPLQTLCLPRLLRCPCSPCRGSIRASGPSRFWNLGVRN